MKTRKAKHPEISAATAALVLPTAAEFDAKVLAEAHHFSTAFFLGRGQFERHDDATLDLAINTARRMKAAYPQNTRKPIIYAINANGRAIPVPYEL